MAIALEFGNIYYDAANFRLTGLAKHNTEDRTLRWFYKKDASSTWIELTSKKQVIPAKSEVTTSAWVLIPRGTLVSNTAYDFRCMVDFSGTTATQNYYSTQNTLPRIFSINAAGSVLSKVKLLPVASLGTATKLHVFKALDKTVRALLRADAWTYVGSADITDTLNTTGYIFNTQEDYKQYDYKLVLTNSSGTITNIIFLED